jgi:4-diphosphocytidyl-2-C-methyl-D-erythritol kinase
MQAIDIYDEINLEKSETIELSCDDPSLPRGNENLAFRAALALRELYHFPGVKIDLKKKIPHGAGLGGGSSDAAFVLRGLCSLYKITAGSVEIQKIASRLGSDVSFFLGTGQAHVSGRGEIVEPVELPTDYRLIVLVPPLLISTADIYNKARYNLTKKSEKPLLEKRIMVSRFLDVVSRCSNDLEEIVVRGYPELAKLKKILTEEGAVRSAMTGSGSAFFGIFPSGAGVEAKIDPHLISGIKVFACKPVILPALRVG